jgi:hypothetical protein
MRLVQTLVVRDEADIVDTQIAYHLSTGVDFVIATDHESRDGTTDILESYARDGYLLRIPEQGDVHEATWRTRMARLAATDYGADWVINTDADEFWVSRGSSLKEVLAAVPPRYGVFWALSRHFVPRPGDDVGFAERMTARVSSSAAINDPTSPYRPHAKAAHRADSQIRVGHGSHTVFSTRLRPLPNWHPVEVFHFPFRALDQYERKGVRRAHGDKPLGQYVRAYHAQVEGRIAERFDSTVVDDATLERGRVAGSLVVDTRLGDALRAAPFDVKKPAPYSVDASVEASVIVEGAVLRDAEVVRLLRTVDGLSVRVDAVEKRSWARALSTRRRSRHE